MNIGDAESAYQEGRITFLEFERDFLKEWYAPLYRAQLAILMASMTPQDMLTPGMEVVAPVANELLGGNDASASPSNYPQKLEIPWTGKPSTQQVRPGAIDTG